VPGHGGIIARAAAIDKCTESRGSVDRDGMSPRVSIMVPTFNNGAQSARDGRRNFISDMLESLAATLKDDPTPLEILVGDDGSSDDSLETCRRWQAASWPSGSRRAGQPFLRLLAWPHCGILSRVANRLMREARGEILVRLDGDIMIHTRNWAARLCEVFDRGPARLGVIGPKQLSPDGRIHAAGDWLLHPRGYHHVAQGGRRESVNEPIEVDHVMGCFYCYRRAVWEEVGEYDESILRGQTEDYGLRVRLRGWRVFVEPCIEFTHHHVQRLPRHNLADTADGLAATLDRFREKWGFDRLAPDLEDVAARYAGTPLLWNTTVFGPLCGTRPDSSGPAALARTRWGSYAHDPEVQAAVHDRLRAAAALAVHGGMPRRIAYVGSREGLVCHLLAREGIECIGLDPDEHLAALATAVTARAAYPGPRPRFLAMTHHSRLPLPERSVEAVLLFDVMETHPNPVRLLREARRVLAKDGRLAILTTHRREPLDAPGATSHPFRAHELNALLRHVPWFKTLQPADGGSGSLLLAVAQAAGSVDDIETPAEAVSGPAQSMAAMI
jgi:glycosyltransferase involved in cell wall biosynthesis/SAM-dependent methyltransferase